MDRLLRACLALIGVTAVALCGCAGLADAGIEPLWQQREAEAGRLPVGRVLSVVPAAMPNDPPRPRPLPTGGALGSRLQVDAGARTREIVDTRPLLWRHEVRLRDGTVGAFELGQRFRVGDCVAVRPAAAPAPAALVTALPKACD